MNAEVEPAVRVGLPMVCVGVRGNAAWAPCIQVCRAQLRPLWPCGAPAAYAGLAGRCWAASASLR